MSLVKQLAGETSIYGFSHILSRVLHFLIFTSYLTYKFPDQSQFGIYTDLYAYAAILLVLFNYRMDTAFFRFGSREYGIHRAFGTALIPLFGTVLLAVCLLFCFAPQIASLLKYPEQPYYVKWFALIIGFDALASLPFARYRLEQRPWRFLTFRVINILLTALLVLFFLEGCPLLLANGFDGISSIYDADRALDYIFISNLIASAAVFFLMLPDFLKQKLTFDHALWKKMVWYALPLVIVGIAGSFNQAFAVPLQKWFLGNDYHQNLTSGGIYAAPAKLALLLNLFAVAFNYAAEPFFFRNAGHRDARTIYGDVCKGFLLVASLVLLGIWLYIDLFKYIIGPQYHEALHIVPILLFAYLFLGLYYNVSIWYKLADKTIYGAWISLGGAAITLAISIYFLPRIGYIASAWAAFLCYAAMCVAGYLTGKKHYPIQYPLPTLFFYLILTLGVCLLGVYTRASIDALWLRLLVHTVLLAVYVLVIVRRERAFLRTLIS